MNGINLYNTDCFNILSQLENNNTKLDCIICDLPYYNVVESEFDNQWKSNDEYIEWLCTFVEKCYSVLKEGGNIILFCSRQNMWRISAMMYNSGFTENRTIIWARKRGFNSTRGKSLTSGYEPILFWSKGKSLTFNQIKLKINSKRKEYTKGFLKDGVNLTDVWTDIPALPHNSKEKTNHPTQKPLKLMERIVSLFTNKDDLVADFFMGSGTTGEACVNLKRRFIGVEINKEFFETAQERIQKNLFAYGI